MTRCTPEADIQRAIVHTLRVVLPRDTIIHHSANEVGAGGKARSGREGRSGYDGAPSGKRKLRAFLGARLAWARLFPLTLGL